jgi:hypothetical protein
MSEHLELSTGPDADRDDATKTESWLAEQLRLMVLEEGRGV